jgi:hypothetical protein
MTIPGAFRPQWDYMNEEQQWKWVAYNMIPWYMSFYASWMAADIPKHIMWYEEAYKDQVVAVRGILKFLGVEDRLTDDKIAEVVNTKDNSFHVGVSGRGNLVPDFVKDIAEGQARAWGPMYTDIKKDLL